MAKTDGEVKPKSVQVELRAVIEVPTDIETYAEAIELGVPCWDKILNSDVTLVDGVKRIVGIWSDWDVDFK